MAEYYKAGLRAGGSDSESSQSAFYPLTNWLLANTLIELRGGSADSVPDDKQSLTAVVQSAKISDGVRPSFWNYAALTDVKLVQFINTAKDLMLRKDAPNAGSDKRHEEIEALLEDWSDVIVTGYKKAWDRGGSILKMNSIFEHLEFIRDALEDGQTKTLQERDLLIEHFQEIDDKLRAYAYKSSD